MPGALIGVASCARCGVAVTSGASWCRDCGTVLVPAAAGTAVGTYSPLLAGVARASAGRRYLALSIDVLPPVLALVIGIGQLLSSRNLGEPVAGALLWFAVAAAWLVAQLALFIWRGRSFGRLALGLRTVDDLTGSPMSVRMIISRLGASHWIRRTVTADLARGRDPLHRAIPTVSGSALADGGPLEEAVFGPPAPAETGPRPAAATVLVIFDTGRRQLVQGTLLIGRSPERSRAVDPRSPGPRVEHPLLGLADLSRTLSKTHALLEWSGTVLWVTDLGSANGSVLVSPDGERRPLVPGLRGAAAIGWTVQCGSRTFTVHAAPGAAG